MVTEQSAAGQTQTLDAQAMYMAMTKLSVDLKTLFGSCNFSHKLLRPDSVPSPDNLKAFFGYMHKMAKKCCSLYNQANGLKRNRFGIKSERSTCRGRGKKSKAQAKLSEQELQDLHIKELRQQIDDLTLYLIATPELLKAEEELIQEHMQKVQDYKLEHINLPAKIDALNAKLAALLEQKSAYDVISQPPSDEDASEMPSDDNDARPENEASEPDAPADDAQGADDPKPGDGSGSATQDSGDPNPEDTAQPQEGQSGQGNTREKLKERRRKERKSSKKTKSQSEEQREFLLQLLQSTGTVTVDNRFLALCPLLMDAYVLRGKTVADEVAGNIYFAASGLQSLKFRVRNAGDLSEGTADPASCPALQLTHDPVDHTPDTQLDSPAVGLNGYDFRVPFVPNECKLADWAAQDEEPAREYEAKLYLQESYGFTPPLINILCRGEGVIVYDPFLLKHTAAGTIYRSVPLYSGTCLSVNCMLTLLILYGLGLMPFSRALSTIGSYTNLPLSESSLFTHYQKFCRGFLHRPAQLIASIIEDNSECLCMDESKVNVREHANLPVIGTDGIVVIKDGSIVLRGDKQSYFWFATAGPDEPYQGTVCQFFPGRDAENIVKMLYRPGHELKLKYLMCDGYSGYSAGVEKLQELTGRHIIIARCWQHASRRGDNALHNMGLNELHDEICSYAIENKLTFDQAFEHYRKLQSRGPGDSRFANMNFMIMKILSHIGDMHEFEDILRHPGPDDKYRHDEIRPLQLEYAQEVFEIAEQYAKKDRSINCNERTGKRAVAVQGSGGEFVSYLLNQQEELLNIGKSDKIPLSNNIAERAVKDPAQHRRGFLFLDSLDSCFAYSDLMTIIETCKKNDVNPDDYLHWLVCCHAQIT